MGFYIKMPLYSFTVYILRNYKIPSHQRLLAKLYQISGTRSKLKFQAL